LTLKAEEANQRVDRLKHSNNCIKCGSDISFERNHTHVQTVEGYEVCSCTPCAVITLKDRGLYYTQDNNLHNKNNFSFLSRMQMVD
jgi:hypothetical protein